MALGVQGTEPGADLAQAAAEASGIAPSLAAELYRRALALVATDDARHTTIEAASLESLARAGDIESAQRRAYVLLERTVDKELRREVLAGLGAVLATAGDLRTSTTRYDEAVAIPCDGASNLELLSL